jgi:hypothetical protein
MIADPDPWTERLGPRKRQKRHSDRQRATARNAEQGLGCGMAAGPGFRLVMRVALPAVSGDLGELVP